MECQQIFQCVLLHVLSLPGAKQETDIKPCTLICSSTARSGDGLWILFSYSTRVYEYLLESPSTEVVPHIVGLVHALFWYMLYP